jgi:hypothetical protein
MPLPIILGAVAAGTALFGVKKGVDAYGDTKEAKALNEEAEDVYDAAGEELKSMRTQVKESLEGLGREKLQCWDSEIGRFADLFGELKNVEITGAAHQDMLADIEMSEAQLQKMRKLSFEAEEMLTGGAASVGAGGLAGIAAYGGAMTFATASTGTAIGTLSGAAATNATLAWFGGGSLATGGAGIAGGTVILGGIVAAPVFAVGGMVLSARARKNVANAKENLAKANKAAAEMRNAKSILKGIDRVVTLVDETLATVREKFSQTLEHLDAVIHTRGTDYAQFNQSERKLVHSTVLWAQITKRLLETPLLTEDGALTGEHRGPVKDAKKVMGDN